MFLPDIFKAAMDIVVDDFDSPSRRIDGDGEIGDWPTSPSIAVQNRSGSSGSTYISPCSTYDSRDCGEWHWYAYPLDRVSNPKGFDFPLRIVRHEPQVRNTDVRSPFPPRDLEQDGNTISSSAHGYPRRSGRKCSGSCRSLASVFRVQRWMRSCRSKLKVMVRTSTTARGAPAGRDIQHILSRTLITRARHTLCGWNESLASTPRFPRFDCGIRVIKDFRRNRVPKHRGSHSFR
jgi:hypothetical protein